ncbi:fructoselysine 6-kinase [Candidatus Bathyarchaeota archaeon]|nr:fructoselysine 6-kinase [Candidatus Bathyarchaeota archaeon]
MILRVLGVGDNCVDDYTELGKKYPGGNALNVAVYASRIEGCEADYLGIIGTDENGEFLLNEIKKQGLDTSYLWQEKGRNAVTSILIRDGDRVFADYVEGVQENAVLTRDRIPDISDYSLVHFVVWGFGREHIPKIKGVALSCDFSSKLDDPRTGIMPYLDFSFFSGRHLIEEGENIEEEIRRLKKRTPGLVVMTLGEHGSLVFDGEEIYRGGALPVEVVDTLGSGDAYIAAFLVSKLGGKDIQESINAGHVAASDICKRLGAWGGPD